MSNLSTTTGRAFGRVQLHWAATQHLTCGQFRKTASAGAGPEFAMVCAIELRSKHLYLLPGSYPETDDADVSRPARRRRNRTLQIFISFAPY